VSDIYEMYDRLDLKVDDLQLQLNDALAGEAKALEELATERSKFAEALERIRVYQDEQNQRLAIAEQRNSELEKALMFYSDGNHLLLADPDEWDTCSGEPINWLHDAAGTASVEDGSVAKQALANPTESGASE
jgi:hypothetical protein